MSEDFKQSEEFSRELTGEQVEGQPPGEPDPMDELLDEFSKLTTEEQQERYQREVERVAELESQNATQAKQLSHAADLYYEEQVKVIDLMTGDALFIIDKASDRYKFHVSKLEEMKDRYGSSETLQEKLVAKVATANKKCGKHGMAAHRRDIQKIKDAVMIREVYGSHLDELEGIERNKMTTEMAIQRLKDEHRQRKAEMDEEIRKLLDGAAIPGRRIGGRVRKRQRNEGKQDSDSDNDD